MDVVASPALAEVADNDTGVGDGGHSLSVAAAVNETAAVGAAARRLPHGGGACTRATTHAPPAAAPATGSAVLCDRWPCRLLAATATALAAEAQGEREVVGLWTKVR